MNKKFLTILIIIIAVFLIGAVTMVAVYFSLRPTGGGSNLNQNANTNLVLNKNVNQAILNLNLNQSANVNQAQNANINIQSSTFDETDVQNLAKSFVERFGSFSNQSDFENIVNLKIFMTSKMQKWADDYIDQNKEDNNTGSEYYGITTRAVSLKVLSFGEKEASFLISTQRRESRSSLKEPKIFFQDIEVILKTVDGVWKVDQANWK